MAIIELTHPVGRYLNSARKLLLAAAGMAAFAIPVATAVLNAPLSHAQSPAPAFEVASIKPHAAGGSPGGTSVFPGTMKLDNRPL
jgi:hypothetical protein